MIDFSTLQGLTIPEGVVTQIADASGRVLWALKSGTKAVLQVAKQTLDTYAGETKYTGESFVAIDVYPTKNGTVKVTYGGLTKTVKDTSGVENPNAQTVYFGTLYGVSDSVTTPASGELTIEGDFNAFGCGGYCESAKNVNLGTYVYCSCITAVNDWGDITAIPGNAFRNCTNLALTSLPSGITSIGTYAFYKCTSLVLTSLPSGITSIGSYAFEGCTSLAISSIPNGVTIIDMRTFYGCTGLTRITLPEGLLRLENYAFGECNNLDYVVIPASVVYLGTYSLSCHKNSNGYNDGDYYMRSTVPPEINCTNGYGPFGTSNAIACWVDIWVPVGCGEIYKAAEGWKSYDDRILEAS